MIRKILFLSMIFLLLRVLVARADEEKYSGFGIRIGQSPLSMQGGTLVHYYDGWDDYYPQISANFNRPIELEVFALGNIKKFDYVGSIAYVPEDLSCLVLSAGVQTKSKRGKISPSIGLRLAYAFMRGDLGTVPLGNNTGADFMFDPNSSDKIYEGSKFEMRSKSYGFNVFLTLVPIKKGKTFSIEVGYQSFPKLNEFDLEVKDKNSGKTYKIPWNFNNGNKWSTSAGSGILSSDGIYIRAGIMFMK